MSWLLDNLETIGIAVATAGASVLSVWGVKTLWDRYLRRPDFVLTRRGGIWEIERTKKRTAYEIIWGHGLIEGPSLDADTGGGGFGIPIGEMRHGERKRLEVDSFDSSGANRGMLVWFLWLDKRRRFARSVDLMKSDHFDLKGLTPAKDGSFQS